MNIWLVHPFAFFNAGRNVLWYCKVSFFCIFRPKESNLLPMPVVHAVKKSTFGLQFSRAKLDVVESKGFLFNVDNKLSSKLMFIFIFLRCSSCGGNRWRKHFEGIPFLYLRLLTTKQSKTMYFLGNRRHSPMLRVSEVVLVYSMPAVLCWKCTIV